METLFRNPLVSVIMSLYNNENMASRAVESIISQTYTNWEMILVDDGSTDNTLKVIEEYGKNNKQITIIKNKKNIGLAASLNLALYYTSGEFIARLDGDDTCISTRIETQVKYLLQNPGVDVVGSNVVLVNESLEELGRTNLPLTHTKILEELPRRNPIIHSSILARKSFYDRMNGYDQRLRKKQDYDLWARGANSFKYRNLDECLLLYYVSDHKEISTDLYGLYVRIRNSWRGRYLKKGIYWAMLVFIINCFRKIGYKQKAVR